MQSLAENVRWSILNVIWEDKSVLAPRGAAVTVEDVNVRKEAVRVEVKNVERSRRIRLG